MPISLVKLNSYLLLMSLMVGLSPIPLIAFGISGLYLSVFLTLILISVNLIFFWRSVHFTRQSFYALLVLFFGSIVSVYWQDISYLKVHLLIFVAIIACSPLIKIDHLHLSDLFIRFCAGSVLASILSLLYSLYNPPDWMGILPDGRGYYFFFSSFSNYYNGFFTRPSFIFDEPGTYSFVLCFSVTYRTLINNFESNVNFLRLLVAFGGLVTLSLAHLIFLFFLIFHFRSVKLTLAIFLSALVLINLSFDTPVSSDPVTFDQRLASISADPESDVRISSFFESLSLTNDSLLFGLDSRCQYDREYCNQLYGVIGEHFLAPIIINGLFGSIHYYFALAILIFFAIRWGPFFPIVGFVLLLAQRPYLMDFSYSLMGMLIFAILVNSSEFYRNRSLGKGLGLAREFQAQVR